MKHLLLSIISTALVAISTGACVEKSTPKVTEVDKNLKISIYQTETKDGTVTPVPPALLEETVHISNLVHYAENGDSVTVPFYFSNVEKYSEITGNNIEKQIAIGINGKIIATPTVKMQLNNGACSVLLSQEQVSELF
ncbi:MAG: hypothetical protein K2L30_05075 [Duncaniella sp.]|nr:hypothetical protein [Duncaniella sp.]